MKKVCIDCGNPLSKNVIALNKKLISLELKDFSCLDCLSEAFACEKEDLEIKMEEYKEQGCTLFQ